MSLDFHELRTVHSVVYDVYNIRKYGATGGVDDSAAISRCIEDCRSKGGGIVYFPSGEWSAQEIPVYSNANTIYKDNRLPNGVNIMLTSKVVLK